MTDITTLAIQGGPGLVEWLLGLGFVAICLFMMLVILIQKPKGGGLSGAFGGGAGGGSEGSAFGSRTGDVLTWLTVACFVGFLLLAMGLTWRISPAAMAQDEEPQAESSTDTGNIAGGAGESTPEPETPATSEEE